MRSANAIIGDPDIKMPQWLIEPWWLMGAKGIVAGPPKTHKSRIVLDFCLSIAIGGGFLSPGVANEAKRKFRVFYIQNEMPDWMLKDRLIKMVDRRKYRLMDSLYKRSENTFTFDYKVGHIPIYFHNSMKDAEKHIHQIQPDVIVVDPLYTFAVTDLISRNDIAREIAWLERLQGIPKIKPALIVVHHNNKISASAGSPPSGNSMLGSVLLHGWTECAWYLSRSKGGSGVIINREFRFWKEVPQVTVEIVSGCAGEYKYGVNAI